MTLIKGYEMFLSLNGGYQMFSNFGSARGKRIAYVVLACLIPAALLIAIFNFIQYEQTNATKNIPVAVVNQDKTIESNGEVINMGEQVVSTLKKDHQVKWEFMDEKTAQKKLKSGDVYLEIKLPKDFSTNAGTALEKNPKISNIDVYKSKKNNYLSSMVSTTVADTVTNQVKTDLQEAYSKSLLSGVKKLSTGTKQAAAGTQQLDDGMVQLQDGNIQIVRNLDLLASKMVEFKSGAQTLDDGVNTYTTGVDTLASANAKMLAGIQELSAKAQPLISGTAQLADGSQQVASGVKTYTDGVSTLQSGLSGTLLPGIQQLLDGVTGNGNPDKSLTTSTQKLSDGAKSLNVGISQLKNGKPGGTADEVGVDNAFAQLQSGISANDSIIASVSDMTKVMKQSQVDTAQLKTDMASMKTAMGTLQSLAPLLDQISSAKSQIASLQSQLTMVSGMVKSKDQVSSDQTAATSTQATLDAEIAKLKASGADTTALEAASAANSTANKKLGTDATINANAFNLVKTQSTTALQKFSDQLSGATLTTDDANQMLAQVQKIMTEADTLFNETDPLLSDTTINNLNSVAGSTQTLKESLSHVNTVIDSNLDLLIDGSSQLSDGNSQLNDSSPTLVSGIEQLFDGVANKIIPGANQLVANNAKLNSGAQQVADGNKTLSASAPTLIAGVGQLLSGALQINDGGSQLTAASPQLRSGTGQIVDSTDQAASGSKQLADGSHQVQDGLVTAGNGTNKLNTALQDGVSQLTPVSDSSKNTNHFATPVTTKDINSDTQDLKNTFAPLVLALVLFLSAVVTQLGLFTPKQRKISLLQEPLLAIGVTAVVQAIIADALIGILGVTVSNWVGLTLFTLLTSIFFTLICMLLYHIFGRVGVLFAVLLSLLQVIITGQVFPNAMLSEFYQAVGNILPMTHAIHGFENLINGGDYSVWLAIAFLTVFTAILGGIAYLVDMMLSKRDTNDASEE
ncbi:YhgE/Pip domain-containing protein [Paucilactobacillus nenjiangensis]|uniref:YhgE/Pip domain-containing protein n=2 Tax=Paucilactobacillus nenjiangensis TaxID=1296540 RepID=A0A5P1X0U6_9LACO|nr:YhgE/Pip domain-containing protein [Paucilactobacillus nenjiangensis]